MKKHISLSLSLACGVSTLASSMLLPAFAADVALEPVEFSLTEQTDRVMSGDQELLANTPGAGNSTINETLPEVTVKSAKAPTSKVKKEDNSYLPSQVQAGKMNGPLKDIPQSVTVIPQKILREQNANTLVDALRNVAGLTIQAAEGGRQGDNINIRGFSATGDMYRDGLRDIGNYSRDNFNTERVEVLRGSASVLYGQGSTSGIINQVSKMPMEKNQATLDVTGGSFGYGRVALDVNRKLSDKWLLRTNAMFTNTNSYRNGIYSKRWGIAPTLTYNKGGKNEYTLAYLLQQEWAMPDYGVPFFKGRSVDVPNSRFYGLKNVNYQNTLASIATASHIHRFSETTTLKSVIRHGYFTLDINGSRPGVIGSPSFLSASTPVQRQLVGRGLRLHTLTGQSELNTKFKTGILKHQILLGSNYIWEFVPGWSWTNPTALPNTTVSNPITNPYLPGYADNFSRSAFTHFNDRIVGAYMQDTIQVLPHLKLVGGFRYDHMLANFNSVAAGKLQQSINMWSSRGGILYQPTERSTYYTSYSTSYDPSAILNSLSAQTVNTPPQKSRNMEVGARWMLLQDKLSLRGALFRTDMFNQRNTDPTQNISVLTGRTHADGIELEASGNITKHWQVLASTALMRPIIDKAAGTQANTEGKLPRNVPRYMNGLWSTYTWKYHGNWTLGVGLNGMGKRYADNSNHNWVSGYQVMDAMLMYELKNYALKFNMFNLLGAKYYSALGSTSTSAYAVPGTSRSFQIALSLKR
jgi:catecholate siderophore receptor